MSGERGCYTLPHTAPLNTTLLKTPTMEHLLSNGTRYIQHPIDLLKQELEKNVTATNDFKSLINKKLADERAHKNDEAEILYKGITMLAKENQFLK